MPHLSTITLPNNVTYDIDTTYTAGDGLEITGDDNTISVKFGSTANTACEGNDSRLSDARPASDVYPWAKEPTKPTYTASEVGAVASTEKGSNNGVAELDANGKVPSSQLPSFVDDIIEGYYYNGAFYEDSAHTIQITPESGKIYTDLTTNKIYRWGGSAYVETSQGVVLGETSETAYRGDRGKIAYDHAVDPNRATTSTASGFYKIAHTSEGHIQSTTPVVKSDITNLGIPGEEQIIEKTRAEYDQLTPAEKNNGKYYHITDEDGNFALDKYVRQIPSTDNTDFEVLLSGNGGNTDITTYSKKTDGLTFNPSTNILTTKGDIVASGYTWDGTNTSLQNSITQLNSSIGNKANTSSLPSLSTSGDWKIIDFPNIKVRIYCATIPITYPANTGNKSFGWTYPESYSSYYSISVDVSVNGRTDSKIEYARGSNAGGQAYVACGATVNTAGILYVTAFGKMA